MRAEWLNLTKNPVMEWLITTVILNKLLSIVVLMLVVLGLCVVIVRQGCQARTGCCPNRNSFERSLKRFLRINLGEAEGLRFQLFEPKGEF